MVITGVYFSKTISVKFTPGVETVKLLQTWNSSHPGSQSEASASCSTYSVNSPFITDFFPGKRKPDFTIMENKWLNKTKGEVALIYRILLMFSVTIKAVFKNKQLKPPFFHPSG